MLNNENRYLFKFAWKSVLRTPGRNFFIGFSVSLAVVIAVWVFAFFEGMNTQIERAVVDTNTGFYQFQESHYGESTDSSTPLPLTRELENKLRKNPSIKAFSPELVLDANIATPEGAAGLLVLGISPEFHMDFIPLFSNLEDGEFLTNEDDDSILIGKELAKNFKFNVGDQIVLNYQDKDGSLRSELLTIKGIYHYNSLSFEKRFVYINQKTWQKLFFNEVQDKTLFNRITVITPSLGQETSLKPIADSENLVLKSWKDLNPEMAVVLEFHDGMIRFFFLIIAVTITMTILTPVRMLWQERFKEIKMMNIIGVKNSKFWKIGIFETGIMVFLSFILSSFLLVTILGYQSTYGIDFRFLNEGGVSIERAGIKIPGIIYPLLSPDQLLITFSFVIFVISVSYLWSIYRTLRKLEAAL